MPKSSFSTGKNHSAQDPVAQDAPASAKRPRKKKKTVRVTTPRARSPVVEIPMAPIITGVGTIRPLTPEQRGAQLNEDNGDHEPAMANQMSQSQEPQDMAGDGRGHVQNLVSLGTAVAQDIQTPANEPNWKETIRLAEPTLQSPLQEAPTSSATPGAADSRTAAHGGGNRTI